MSEPCGGRYGWLDDNPLEVGGRDVDVHQLALSFDLKVKNAYPINAVPREVMALLRKCHKVCSQADETVKRLIERVSDDWAPGTWAHRWHKLPVPSGGAVCQPVEPPGYVPPKPTSEVNLPTV